jgi:KDO2-lipid IV(A) lauroyltransferase
MAGRVTVATFKSVATILERVPVRLSRRVAATISVASRRVMGQRRRALRDNLVHAAGLSEIDDALLDNLERRALEGYGAYWAESAALAGLSQAQIQRDFVISEGLEHLRSAVDAGRGVIVALPHVGSWEWGGAYLDTIGMHMTAVAEALEPPALFEWFQQKRESIGITVAPLDAHAGTVLLGTLARGGVVGLVSDRDIVGGGVEVSFFGEHVTMPPGPATMALRTGAALVTAACYAGPGEGHHAVVNAPIVCEREGRLRDDVQRITQRVATELEQLIRRSPDQWHVLQPRFDVAP